MSGCAANVEKVVLHAACHRSDWRQGTVGFLREAGFDVVWAGNFVDQGWFASQEELNAQVIRLDERAKAFVADKAPLVGARLAHGTAQCPRASDGVTRRFCGAGARTRGHARETRDHARHRTLPAHLQDTRHGFGDEAGRPACVPAAMDLGRPRLAGDVRIRTGWRGRRPFNHPRVYRDVTPAFSHRVLRAAFLRQVRHAPGSPSSAFRDPARASSLPGASGAAWDATRRGAQGR